MNIDVLNLIEGDKQAFNAIYYAFQPQVYNYVLNKIGNSYFAEEVTQLTFIKLWERRKQVAVDIDIGIQVFRIAKTVLIDQLRKMCRKKNDIRYLEASTMIQDPDNHLLNNISYKDTYRRLDKILDALPPARKRVFELSRLAGLSHKEISELLQISPKTVENHITKALKYIKPLWNTTVMIMILFNR
ncbi:sigma-70 family RNA polymerase sigma factor [Niabella beijingensis]|uniref:sigma-70 family RNA polymerase sigma factor n=1 Tax=Niabella beijingensis TaxID=2872700 RepID=UPI001CBF4EDA|nr:sigma-70 family RNA polymerase sigma factor [Niabella beijingensis]MBZ4190285.1 sigma-70 family RNA polymerase sigma factor [Niabella beijingensis]